MGKIEFNWEHFRDQVKRYGRPSAEFPTGLTQKTKARQMGISQSKLSRLETGSGSVSISVDDLASICAAMDTHPCDYFGYLI